MQPRMAYRPDRRPASSSYSPLDLRARVFICYYPSARVESRILGVAGCNINSGWKVDAVGLIGAGLTVDGQFGRLFRLGIRAKTEPGRRHHVQPLHISQRSAVLATIDVLLHAIHIVTAIPETSQSHGRPVRLSTNGKNGTVPGRVPGSAKDGVFFRPEFPPHPRSLYMLVVLLTLTRAEPFCISRNGTCDSCLSSPSNVQYQQPYYYPSSL